MIHTANNCKELKKRNRLQKQVQMPNLHLPPEADKLLNFLKLSRREGNAVPATPKAGRRQAGVWNGYYIINNI